MKKYKKIFFVIGLLALGCLGTLWTSTEFNTRGLPGGRFSFWQEIQHRFSDQILAKWKGLWGTDKKITRSDKTSSQNGAEYFASVFRSVSFNPDKPLNPSHKKNSNNKINRKRVNQTSPPENDEPSDVKETEQTFFRNLTPAVIGEDYCAYLDPAWGQNPYQWLFTNGILPQGLKFDSKNGMLCGTPAQGGVWSFAVRISDSLNKFILVQYQLVVLEFEPKDCSGELTIATDKLPAGVVGKDYFGQLAACGGKLPYSWSTSNLPAGLNFEKNFGIIYGRPSLDGQFNLNLRVSDQDSKQTSKTSLLEITTSPLYITTTSLPPGIVGSDYCERLSSQGGKPPYSWYVIAGVIPQGIVFGTRAGTLCGQPLKPQSETIRFKVADRENDSDSADLEIAIAAESLSIADTELESGTVGKYYSHELQAKGGHPLYQWSIEGNLPQGLNFQNTGLLIGTPLDPIDSDITFKVTDKDGNTADKKLPLTILAALLTIQSPALQIGNVCTDFDRQLEANGGYPQYQWNIESGKLPDGISLNLNGVLTGKPTNAENYLTTIKVTDTKENVSTKEFTFDINDEDLQVSLVPITVGKTGALYSFQLQTQGGATPYSWKINSGFLPKSLILSTSGLISGVPEESGMFPFNVEVSDSCGHFATVALSIAIIEKNLEIITDSTLPEASVGTFYSVQINAQGGIPPYRWSIISGGLPAGLTLNTNTGVISGTPEKSGDFSFTLRVDDAIDEWVPKEFHLKVSGSSPPIITTASPLPPGAVGTSYTITLSVSGGTSPYTWAIALGQLPIDLELDAATGKITGTPAKSGTTTFTVRVTDQNQAQDSKTFSLQVQNQPLSVTSPDRLPDGKVDENYPLFNLSAIGGELPYTWQITVGQLPGDLILNSQTGLISGIPKSTATNLSLTFQVSDAQNQKAAKTLLFTIIPADLGPVTKLIARGSQQKVGLAWVNPAGDNFDHVKIVRKDSDFPQNPDDGKEVYAGTANNIVDTDTDLENNKTYYYAAFAFDTEGKVPSLADDSKATAKPVYITTSGENDPFTDEVVSHQPLDPNNCYGKQNLPNVVLGAPKGGGEWFGSGDVVSLHAKVNDNNGQTPPYGGSITLKFSDNIVFNDVGVDFTVFENAFRTYGTTSYFMEPAVVDVSVDGTTYYRIPFDFVPHYDYNGKLDLTNPYCYATGFAGIKPVYSYSGNPDPTNPAVSGGDSFDLSSIPMPPGMSLTWIQYIKITSTGDNWLVDMNGDLVRHASGGPTNPTSGTGNSGFDLDAVSAAHY